MLAKEKQDNDVVKNYIDTLALINQKYIEQLRLGHARIDIADSCIGQLK